LFVCGYYCSNYNCRAKIRLSQAAFYLSCMLASGGVDAPSCSLRAPGKLPPMLSLACEIADNDRRGTAYECFEFIRELGALKHVRISAI
jgi:hypothetical protein